MTKKIADVPDINQKEFLEIIAGKSTIGRRYPLTEKSEIPEINKEDEISELSVPTETINLSSDRDNMEQDKLPKRTLSSKQRKSNLCEYQEMFLGVPKITDRKTVFISNELRERIVEVILRLGTEKSSVSGFVENLVKAHLSDYEEDINAWRKL
ncbi:hypothetical protein M2132_002272 [Dysgonomonas sp. PH5-45]|uniref:DUF3408 domain-containing protein n=1 Tax=unclassified Dysgonomonas TaxID=2630389 RepID=UPI00247536A7|nr:MULTISPECIES: DUF3408 domain-containing protein [unclassified Dysgonomonas]MDH6355921.1 hypothetical protein [Dysgonomonas sp. PH5-45]MDH6388816.1 hypothetical protein [Dysgonomonas sp. PH5-37]